MKKIIATIISLCLLISSVAYGQVTGSSESSGHVTSILQGVKKGALKNSQRSQNQSKPKVENPGETIVPGQKPLPKDAAKKTDRIIVKFKNGANVKTIQNLVEANGLKKVKSIKGVGLQVYQIPSGATAEKMISQLQSNKNVESVSPDYKYFALGDPAIQDEPMGEQLWNFENSGQDVFGQIGIEDIDIDLNDAWSITRGNSEVVVAVIDTGMDINHPDLKDRIWVNQGEIPDNGIDDDANGYIDDVNGWDFWNHDNTVFDIMDGDDHATHVAGTIAGSLNNVGVAGIAPEVKIMPIKFIGPYGGYLSDAVEAIEYAKNMGVKISNNSWGGGEYSELLKQAIEESGMLFVAAAGNWGMDIDEEPMGSYPAAFDCPNIISVAAINNLGEVPFWSNYGQNTVDIAAPGENVLSSLPAKPEGNAVITHTTPTYQTLLQGFGNELINDPELSKAYFSKILEYFGLFPEDKILLVQDDGSPEYPNVLSYYQNPLNELGFANATVFNVAPGEQGPDASTMREYALVIWFTGKAFDSYFDANLTSQDLQELAAYLDNGGRLFLSGRDCIYLNEYSILMQEYLGAEFLFETEGYQQVAGNEGTLFRDLNIPIDYDIAEDHYAPGAVENASAVMHYVSGGYDNAYGYYSGTSMATPHVTGVGSLLFALGDTEPHIVKLKLLKAAVPLPSLVGKCLTESMLNAGTAVSCKINLEDEIPGHHFTGSVTGELDSTTDRNDVYWVNLKAGEVLSIQMIGTGKKNDFDLHVYGPDAFTVESTKGLVASSEEKFSYESITYAAEKSGLYFINAYAYAGSGLYSISMVSPVIVDDRSKALVYSGNWIESKNTACEFRTLKTLNSPGGVTMKFTGKHIEWKGIKNSSMGIAQVLIDGVDYGEVNLYSTKTSYKQTLFAQDLPYGAHTIEIKWTGKWDPAAKKSATSINVDTITYASLQ